MTKTVCVVGLGYIGLTSAVMFSNYGMKVHGVDINPSVVRNINEKKLHIEEQGLQELLDRALEEGTFTASTTPQEADAFIISVPTPINSNKTANLDYVKEATKSIVPYVKKGNLVILESTVPPKTVENIMIPELMETGLEIGTDIYVAHSPERVIPGKIFEELVKNDRIVGGINEKSAELTKELYESFVQGEIHLTDATTAELVKVMENTYRDLNIAFANELSKIADNIGVNIWEAIQFANLHPRVNIHFPGPGVGGHCIAVDPWFLVEIGGDDAQLIHLSRHINDSMPAYTAQKTLSILKDNKIEGGKVAVLGLAFKGNVNDIRESPSITVIDYLQQLGLEVVSFDPHIKENNHETQTQYLEEATRDADILLFLTDHHEFKTFDPLTITTNNKIVFDTKNCLNRKVWQNAGFQYYLLGDAKFI
ncbi:nucleotide sugar dehydrogenase [Ureibacillus sp. Re31]|uniref:Nucleotide sugar dehydrogenase n=1 Tax=Ureibacillus galli TaxID=2762222 RepID=A0ABR8X7Z5_9BACL|nr:nucleotide sugar dehydrogenase [Ureibacillus galli]MBD8025434.1 nucleotide sugar dehydrogenase [Ureibacillus galli]